MGLTSSTGPDNNEDKLESRLKGAGCPLPEHLSHIGPHGWYSHWFGERIKGEWMEGQWSSLARDTALVLGAAESLNLTSANKFFTQYTHIVATMHFALQLNPENFGEVFRLQAPDIREKICQLRTDLESSDLKNDPLSLCLLDRLEKRFNAYVSEPSESYVRVEERIMNPEWLNANGISLEALTRYLDNLRLGSADAGAVFFRDSKGEFIKLAEYLPPWSQDENGEVISYDMMSSTKSVMGLLCFIAASRQLLDLDQSITEILDVTQASLPQHWDKITPRHLLNQASGLARNIRYDTGMEVDSLSEHLAVPFENEPGTSLLYSNAGTQLLGFVLDAALKRAGYTGEPPVIDFAKKYLFDPLGMTRTSLGVLWDMPQIPLADRSLQSTSCEFALFARVLLDPEATVGPDNAPILSREDRSKLFQPASISLRLSGARELDQDTQRDNYANCFYLKPYGIATRGTYDTNMDLVFAKGLPRDAGGEILFDELDLRPCLIFVTQKSDAGPGGTSGSRNLEDLMMDVWHK